MAKTGWLLSVTARDAISHVRMLGAFEFDGIIFEGHRVAIFKERANDLVGAWIARRAYEELATLRCFTDFAIFEHHFAALDDVFGLAEHADDVFVVVIQHEIGIASHA